MAAAEAVGQVKRPPLAAVEKHYSVAQIAEAWGWSKWRVQQQFAHEPGVLRMALTRGRVALRIPESVLKSVYARLSVPGKG